MYRTYSPPALPASILRTIAIAWPQIQKLALEVPFEATGRDLLPFAEHCPKLIEFEVPLHFCFGDLEDFPPGTFFPRLESIRADWAVQTLLSCNDPGAEVPDKVLEDLKQNVERVMPRLLGLSVFSDKDDNTMDIINRLNDAIGEKPKAPLPQSVMERLQHEAVFGS